jgi:hypothetical protein
MVETAKAALLIPFLSCYLLPRGKVHFSFVAISGLYLAKYRGDEQIAPAPEAALPALVQNAPALVPLLALPPAARTRRPLREKCNLSLYLTTVQN